MARIYRIPMPNIEVTAQQDLFEITNSSSKLLEILELHLSQLTEVGDAAEEMLLLLAKTGATSAGAGGTSPTIAKAEMGDADLSATTKINNTTKASGGTIITHFPINWNVRVPLDIYLPPETYIKLAPSTRFTLELATTPADSITMGGFLLVREHG